MTQAHTTGDAMTTGNAEDSGSGGLDLDLSGRQLGDYRMLRRLGRGAMADVYLAEQGSLRRQVAFKVLKRELAADELYVRRFHMEAQSAASLVQANIVQIYEVGRVEGMHYIAQEYVEGQNLSQYLARHGSPETKLAVAVMRQVTAALCKAAERGIVHRDIKPENIMLARSGEVKVADFGLARVTATDDTVKLTQVGITMGTPLYMSPEQVENRPLDSRSDIYSLGVTCYQMLAGRPPFRGDTALAVALQHVRAQPERLENSRRDLPPALARIIHKMLAKDPADRYQSPRELLQELRGLQIEGVDMQWPAELDELGSVETAALGLTNFAGTQRLQTVMRTQALAQARRSWRRYLVAAVIAAVMLGGGAAWLLREQSLLHVPASEMPKFEPMTSAKAQLDLAANFFPEDEDAWLSVGKYFPHDEVEVLRSKQGLARLYAQTDRLNRALSMFSELASAINANDDLQKQFRVFGFAGQSYVYYQMGEKDKSTGALKELANLVGSLEVDAVRRYLVGEPYVTALVAYVVLKNKEFAGQRILEEWRTELRTQVGSEETDSK